MNKGNISSFLQNAEEYKNLFSLGQKIVPLLQELFNFILEMDPLLQEINDSINENINSMPIVSNRLSKVTEATENASYEIMNLVERISNNSMELLSILNDVKSYNDNIFKIDNDILALADKINPAKYNEDENVICLLNLIKTKREIFDNQLFEKAGGLIDTISDDTTSIMMSLQVQDITTQQIASVNHILLTIQSKFSVILDKFSSNGIRFHDNGHEINSDNQAAPTEITTLHRAVAFDVNEIEKSENVEYLQNDIDKIFS